MVLCCNGNILVIQESEAKEMKMKKEIERLQEENHQLRSVKS